MNWHAIWALGVMAAAVAAASVTIVAVVPIFSEWRRRRAMAAGLRFLRRVLADSRGGGSNVIEPRELERLVCDLADLAATVGVLEAGEHDALLVALANLRRYVEIFSADETEEVLGDVESALRIIERHPMLASRRGRFNRSSQRGRVLSI